MMRKYDIREMQVEAWKKPQDTEKALDEARGL